MQKREPALDLLRCLALLLVVSFHSFLNNGYYSEAQRGTAMWLAGSFRWLSVCCIGLFLMLTGYLKSGKTEVGACHRGFIPVLLGYLLASAISIPIRHFWLGAVTLEFYLLPGELRDLEGLEGLARMSLSRVLLLTCAGTLLLWGLSRRRSTAGLERWMLAGLFGALTVAALCSAFTWAFLGACVLILVGLVVYALRGWNKGPEPAARGRESRTALWLTVGLTLAFFLLVSAWTVGRVRSFSAPTYDFGIFSQMFHNMKTTGLPVTTLERDGALSHFKVHLSPIWYLLLPFYCLVPRPETLQVLQAAVLASAVIPLWKLGAHHGLSGWQRMLLCGALLLYPAFAGGTGYDIHENCFLTPLLLWLFYGVDRKNTLLTAVAGLLTLMVKEDAAVYVAVAALWLLLRALLRREGRWALCTGAALFAGALFWFFLATGYLARYGDGVMSYRYDNLIYDGSDSLLTVVKAVLLSPMKALYECVDGEKLRYIALTLLPLLGLPLLTRRYERWLLLIPYLLVNLLSDYRYQHDIFFQYNFGSTACLFYLMAVNLADLRLDGRRSLALLGAVAVSAACFGALIVPKALSYPGKCIRNSEEYGEIRALLDEIPADAAVSATTYYTAQLSRREVLYDVRYAAAAHILETEYVVLNLRSQSDYKRFASADGEDGLENLLALLEREGYAPWAELPGVLVIYRDAP
ncbi:MAG: DUF2079 domain-containing protein [Oscillospiraceae bacterium]|nr:DUF2079 domain-containing protein [Oscillospiraceae bacterium]